MKMNAFALFTFPLIAALLEGVVVPIPISTALLVGLSVSQKGSAPLVFGFISGMLLDLFSVRLLGTTSILFLLIAIVIMLYKRRFHARHMLFVFVVMFSSCTLFTFVISGAPFLLWQVVYITIFAAVATGAYSLSQKVIHI